VLTRADLASVEPRKTEQGQAYVRFGFSQAGAQKLAALSQRNPGKLLVLTLNNSLVAAPRIEGTITNGVLDVGFASEQQALNVAREIAGRGNAG
jgi:preprotein translocase subunit SecD